MFLKTFIEPDEVLIVKVIKSAAEEKSGTEEKEEAKEKDAPEKVHNL